MRLSTRASAGAEAAVYAVSEADGDVGRPFDVEAVGVVEGAGVACGGAGDDRSRTVHVDG
jgi:hypothetical protein